MDHARESILNGMSCSLWVHGDNFYFIFIVNFDSEYIDRSAASDDLAPQSPDLNPIEMS